TLDTRLRPAALLQRKVLLEEIQIKGLQAEVVRRADGSFTNLGLEEHNESLLPGWVKVDGLSLTESMLVLRDANTGHEYRLDDIAFSLPSAASAMKRQDAATPTLHALVNGNPVQIQGERQLNPDKGPVTRLTLELDDVDPQQILAWLPSIHKGLRITSQKTTASLELILPDNPQHEEKLTLSGIISFTGLNMSSSPKKEGVDQKDVFQCTAPNAELILQANPFRKQYRVVDLKLNNPELSFSANNDKNALPSLPLSHWPGQIFSPAFLPVDLMIDHLSINNGTLQREQKGQKGQEQVWKNLQVKLTGYQNQALPAKNNQENEPATLSFSAQQGTSKVRFQGTTTPHLDLIGKISFHNLDASLLQPYLRRGQAKNQIIQLTDGKADLVMQVNPVQKQYIITELTLKQPRLLLTESGQKANNISNPSSSSAAAQLPFSVHPSQLLQPDSLPFDLKVDRFIINNGRLDKKQGPAWQNLQVNLVDYHNRTSSSAPLSFTARQGKNTVRFQGTTTPDLSLNGKVFLGNLSLDQIQPYLGSKHGLLLSGGIAEVNGLLQTVQGRAETQSMQINQASILVNNIKVHKQEQQGTALLSADSATAKECSINLTATSLSCADLILQQADFSAAAPSFFLAPEKQGAFSGLSLNTSRYRTPQPACSWGTIKATDLTD
ncbi:MAG: DUF748 domain-containing protein, partial [Candidatus Electrothrix sp. MAN1_4]|nr:DUF748 domain-containing protein [Candidatus Electrothrix sp. MAN1_4]